MKTIPSRQEMFAAEKFLKAQGWTKQLSATYAGSPEYGILYTKNGVQFWLNKDTIGKLPTE